MKKKTVIMGKSKIVSPRTSTMSENFEQKCIILKPDLGPLPEFPQGKLNILLNLISMFIENGIPVSLVDVLQL